MILILRNRKQEGLKAALEVLVAAVATVNSSV
jgi:hypothetical protein